VAISVLLARTGGHQRGSQHSIWRTDREAPLGWREEGTVGTRSECLAHINRIWTDMRPVSLREQDVGAAADARLLLAKKGHLL
jgi:MbtH protein